jgi:hypothetical protein
MSGHGAAGVAAAALTAPRLWRRLGVALLAVALLAAARVAPAEAHCARLPAATAAQSGCAKCRVSMKARASGDTDPRAQGVRTTPGARVRFRARVRRCTLPAGAVLVVVRVRLDARGNRSEEPGDRVERVCRSERPQRCSFSERRQTAEGFVYQVLVRGCGTARPRSRVVRAVWGPSPSDAEPGPLGHGSTAGHLTLTVAGRTVTVDLATKTQTPARTDPSVIVPAKSNGTVYDGSVALDGTLPTGWSVYVWHIFPTVVLAPTPTGGTFQVREPAPGFTGFTEVGAYLCPSMTPCNPPAAQANIDAQWTP